MQGLLNIPEFTVGEFSSAFKSYVEDGFSHLRIRGEISGLTRAASGHLYFSLKDEKAVLNAVSWKGMVSSLGIKPEEGLEVIAEGRITSYAPQSRYQMVVSRMDIAGEGALLQLLEKRRKAFEKEGLFDPARKKPLPSFPNVIGVITSPTGAVIQDILHRLEGRFPLKLILWPVRVQGGQAAAEVANAIQGFNRLRGDIRPELLIVARGGGSIEDLWAFNEEEVVRALASSDIATISAIGHETDNSLSDFAADCRAPTPTAAVEMAVPITAQLLERLAALQARKNKSVTTLTGGLAERLEQSQRITRATRRLFEQATQSLDRAISATGPAMRNILTNIASRFQPVTQRFPFALTQFIKISDSRISGSARRLEPALNGFMRQSAVKYHSGSGENMRRMLEKLPALLARKERNLEARQKSLEQGTIFLFERFSERVNSAGRLLETASYRNILRRGFALVRNKKGDIIHSAEEGERAGLIDISFGNQSVLEAQALVAKGEKE